MGISPLLRTVAILLGMLVLVALALPTLRRPGRTIFPLFAATLPIASVVSLPIPLPTPFNTLSSLLGGLAIVAGVLNAVAMRRVRLPSWPTALWLLFFGWICFSV